MYDLVIKNGLVVTAEEEYVADVAVQGEQIAAVGQDLAGRRELDADGLYVLPGAIDGHVHMQTDRREFVYDDTFESGTAAAAFGGVTTIVDQAQVEAGTALLDGLAQRRAEGEGRSLVDFGLHVNPREPDYEQLADFAGIAAAGCPSFKFFMVYDGFRVPDAYIFAAMQQVAELGALAIVHAENDEIIGEILRQNEAAGRRGGAWNAAARPPAMEGEAVHRTLAMASVTGARTLIFHLTAAEAVRELRAARARGQDALGEACLTYLVHGPEALEDPVSGTAFDFSPPLRGVEHRDALWAGLADGTIDIVSTDHGPRRRIHHPDGSLTTPPGTSGIEVRLALVHTLGVLTGRLSRQRWVDVCCTRPAEVMGLPGKGRLRPGWDADIVLFDPARRVALSAETLHSAIDFSTYDGLEAIGFPVTTIGRGEILVHDGVLLAAPGRGRFVARRHASAPVPTAP